MKGHTPAGRVAVPSELQGDLLDFSHLSFVHEKTLGGSDAIARSRPTIEPVPRGLRVTRRVYDVPSPGAYRRMGAFDGNVDRWFIYEFLLPGTLLMRSGGRPASTDFSDDDKRAVRLHSWQSLTPETEHSTHYFFQQSHPSDQGDDSLTQAIYDGLLVAFHDDAT